MQIAYDFQRNRDPFCMYRANASTSVKNNSTRSVGSEPTSALTGPSDFGSVIFQKVEFDRPGERSPE